MNKFKIPVLIPDSIIKMDIPVDMLKNSMDKFNDWISSQFIPELNLHLKQLIIYNDDLYLLGESAEDMSLLIAKLKASLLIDKETGEYNEVIIDGFDFEKRVDKFQIE